MKISLKTILKSVNHAFNGIKISSEQHNFRVMLLCAVLVVILAIVLKVTIVEWLILILIINLILSLETINTALEKLCDYIEPNPSDKIRIIKDLASGAEIILCFTSVIIGIIIFLPKIIYLF